MAERIKSLDYVVRRVKFVERAPGLLLDEVLSILDACLYAPSLTGRCTTSGGVLVITGANPARSGRRPRRPPPKPRANVAKRN